MGFMTTVLILNDGLDQIEAHPDEFVQGILQSLNKGGTVGVGNHANPVTVMPSEHADYFRLYATQANTIVELTPNDRTVDLYKAFPDHVRGMISQARDNLDRLELACMAAVEEGR